MLKISGYVSFSGLIEVERDGIETFTLFQNKNVRLLIL